MSNDYLRPILKTYSHKKLQAEIDADNRKEQLYSQIPILKNIDNDLNTIGITLSKNILFNQTSSQECLKNKIDLLKLKKEQLLAEHNINYSYLQPNYECAICNDTGYIKDNNLLSQMCSCLKQKLLDISFDKSNLSQLNNQNFSKFNPNLFSDEVDLSKYKFNKSPRNNILDIKEQCVHFINNFEDPNTKDLLFSGNTGLR